MPPTRLGRGREFDLIRRILDDAPLSRREPDGVVLGPGDDCAIINGSGVCVSVDMSVEGVHFRRDWLAPGETGYRAVTAALSDLAAMAAAPVGVLVALACPRDDDAESMIVDIMRGATAACIDVGAALLGGDITRTPGPVVIDVVVIGTSPSPALRSGARPGDELWVTGQLGGAAAAVSEWRAGRTPSPDARRAFARPVARIAEARWLAERRLITALIDISDGIAGDADHLAAASGVQITLDAARIPIDAAARDAAINATTADDAAAEDAALDLALFGGEDYELCFAAPPGSVEGAAAAFARDFGVRLTRVGDVSIGAGTALRSGDVVRDIAGGFDHFAPVRKP